MIIVRTYRHNATFGFRIDDMDITAPIYINIGTMVDGWLDPKTMIELTIDDANNIINALQSLVDHHTEV